MQNNSKFSVGFIGLGLIGQKRARSLPSSIEIKWGVDPFDIARKNFSDLFNCETFEKIENVNLVKTDIIFISTTHEYLSKYATLSLENNIHTFVEKPGGINLKAIEDIKNIYCKKKNLGLYFGFNHRFHPAVLALKENLSRLKEGDTIKSIRANYGHGGRKNYHKEWRMDRKKSGGGELLDQGSHLIDLVHDLTDKSYSIEYSNLRNIFWGGEVEDNALMILKSKDCETIANLNASWTEWKNKFIFEVFTNQKQFVINGLGGSYGTESLTIYEMSKEMGPPKTTIYEYPGADLSWQLETKYFISKLEAELYTENNLNETMKLHDIVNNIYKLNYVGIS